jgi:predicted nucleic acid-binding protein
MLFLDSSAIIAYSDDREPVVEHVDGGGELFTSTICVYEVVEGEMWHTGKSAYTVRQGFAGVKSLPVNEEIVLEAARLQHQLRQDGDEMPVRDLLIGATARSTGAELVVADDDFAVDHLRNFITVTDFSHTVE